MLLFALDTWQGSPLNAQDSFSIPPCQNTQSFLYGPSTQLVTTETASCVGAPLRGEEGGRSCCHSNTRLLSSSPHSVPSRFQRGRNGHGEAWVVSLGWEVETQITDPYQEFRQLCLQSKNQKSSFQSPEMTTGVRTIWSQSTSEATCQCWKS